MEEKKSQLILYRAGLISKNRTRKIRRILKRRAQKIKRILEFLLEKTQADIKKKEAEFREIALQNTQGEFEEGDADSLIIVEDNWMKILSVREQKIEEALEALKNGWVLGICFDNCGRPTLPEDKIDIVLKSHEDWWLIPYRLYCAECTKKRSPKPTSNFCGGSKRWSHTGSKRSKRSRR